MIFFLFVCAAVMIADMKVNCKDVLDKIDE